MMTAQHGERGLIMAIGSLAILVALFRGGSLPPAHPPQTAGIASGAATNETATALSLSARSMPCAARSRSARWQIPNAAGSGRVASLPASGLAQLLRRHRADRRANR